MSQRKLTKKQMQRIRSQQQPSQTKVIERGTPEITESELGPERPGLVVANYGKQVGVENINSPGESTRCYLRANLKPVTTGDRVSWKPGRESGVVVSVDPRDTVLVRPDGYGKLRLVAANIDQVIITLAPEPEPHHNLLDRYLAVAENLGIRPLIVLNKVDIYDTIKNANITAMRELYLSLNYTFLDVSARCGEGLQTLTDLVKGKTSIFVGQSGVGKSSIIKSLMVDKTLDIKIGQLSSQKTKGRHTTTFSQLYHFAEGGKCIDSPGIREFGLWHLTPGEVVSGFVELREIANQCQFRDCAHKREPGCAVRTALTNGHLSIERFDSFQRIINSLDDVTIKNRQ